MPGLESEWISLSRDYDTLQESYRGLLQKSEESKVAANLERQQIGEQFRVLDPPRVPLAAAEPAAAADQRSAAWRSAWLSALA